MGEKDSKEVTSDEVKKIAALSKMNIEGSELEQLTQDFNQILDFVKQINEVNTKDIEPLKHVLNLENVTRPDEPVKSFDRSEVEKLTPNFSAGYFVVPQVIDAES